ncbi:MAG: serpin family protein [Muribaculaceae bacterium]|nr:serpin family protein [Muribaculaceae bacterium]
MQRWITRQTCYGLDLLGELAGKNSDDNILISPPGVALELSMIAAGADAQTASEIITFLGVDSQASLDAYWKSIIDNFSNLDPGIQLTIANSVWKAGDLALIPSFSDALSQNYNAEVFNMYTDMGETTRQINSWISTRTHGMIEDFYNEAENLSPVTLVNALTFKAKWESPFDPALTRIQPFTSEDGNISDTRMMHGTKKAYLMEYDFGTALRLDFSKGLMSAMFILPESELNLNAVLSQISSEMVDQWCDSRGRKFEVDITLPVLDLTDTRNLRESLGSFGVTALFNQNSWPGMTSDPLEWTLGDIRHKTCLKMDEEGVKAAAAAGATGDIADLLEHRTFTADRPYIFMIVERGCKLPLFMGVVRKL